MGILASLWVSRSRASRSLRIFASCRAETSDRLRAAWLRAARFRLVGCSAACAGEGPTSGTYAHPGALVFFVLASSITPKLFMVARRVWCEDVELWVLGDGSAQSELTGLEFLAATGSQHPRRQASGAGRGYGAGEPLKIRPVLGQKELLLPAGFEPAILPLESAVLGIIGFEKIQQGQLR